MKYDERADARVERRSALRRVALPLFVGMILIQAAWVLALPPFRGTDEIDHAYRAVEVAGGEWVTSHGRAANGRGDLVRVPRSLVVAAAPICESLNYMGHDNCHPASDAGGGDVLAASAAATYNPVFYWVVGTFAKGFAGAPAVYVMRAVTALICALLVSAAGWVVALWSRSRWPLVALVVAMSPVMVFSASVTAPNGLELCAALALWAALLGLIRPDVRRHSCALLVVAGVAATLLVTLRSIGPLWAALIVLTVAALAGPARALSVVRDSSRRALVIVTATVGLATGAGVWWTLSIGVPNFEEAPSDPSSPVSETLAQYPLWFLQGVAAFPRRMDAAPGLVYIIIGLATLGLLTAGFTAAPRRLRWTMVAATLVALGVPFILTVTTIASTGPIWQGRYGAPYHMGLVLLSGLALDARATRARWIPPVAATLWVGIGIAHAASIVHVLHRERRESPLTGSDAWVQAPSWVVVALVGCAFLTWSWPMRQPSRGNRAWWNTSRSPIGRRRQDEPLMCD